MNLKFLIALALLSLTCSVAHSEEPEKTLNERLAVFKPMLGKTWRGKFVSSKAEKPPVDIARWERALNGQAVKITHSIGDGEYGGESILMWNPKESVLNSWYFTTAGFFTQGTVTVDGNSWTTLEELTGNANGVTKVRATSTILDSGEMHIKTEFFANDQWMPGHEIHYQHSPESEVKFK